MAESSTKETRNGDQQMSELDLPTWSVVSFDQCEFSGLTFANAIAKMAELESRKVAGLCIVTDDAAARIGS